MQYSGLMPSMEAIQQACREPLDGAPREHKAFAVYIFERARVIERQMALAAKLSARAAQQKGRSIAGAPH